MFNRFMKLLATGIISFCGTISISETYAAAVAAGNGTCGDQNHKPVKKETYSLPYPGNAPVPPPPGMSGADYCKIYFLPGVKAVLRMACEGAAQPPCCQQTNVDFDSRTNSGGVGVVCHFERLRTGSTAIEIEVENFTNCVTVACSSPPSSPSPTNSPALTIRTPPATARD